ncbi:MAG: anthranilate synthase component I family protein [Pyrinomonadaceae bacterium]|nr:anthranilate synthase component I family protein [Pyrinomonadaceae bacterium]
MLELYPKTFEEFQKESAKGNVVPIVRSVLADLHTPVSAFLRIASENDRSFLFESVEGGEKIARFSFLAANPKFTITSSNGETYIDNFDGGPKAAKVSLLEFLREHFRENKLAVRENLPPLCGGAVGFFAYSAAKWFETALSDGNASKSEDANWMFFRDLMVFDRVKQRIEIVSVVFTDEAQDDERNLRQLFENAVDKTRDLEARLKSSAEFQISTNENVSLSSDDYESNWKKADFLSAVAAVKEKILAGDAYQVVLSQRFTRQTNAAPMNIYRALRTTNPSPYMFYLNFGEKHLIGASPEMLIRSFGRDLEYRPIAGTRKRGANEAEDAALGLEMLHDVKEVSEHTMLVDLGRNDLGRVSEFGSVKVAELMKIERYSHVQHLVTSLRSKLKAGLDRFDALGSCFPAGTVSGAPKVAAMRIIDELEPTSRGVYSGAIGYIDYAENLDTCIAIRTIELENGVATIQAGAGIVADSVPESEFQETLNKALALRSAIELAETFDELASAQNT